MSFESLLSQSLETYRDIEVAKRENPRVVQAAEHQQTPFTQNVNAPAAPVQAKSPNVAVAGVKFNRNILYITGGVIAAVAVGSMLLKKRR